MSWKKDAIFEDDLYGIQYWGYYYDSVPYIDVYRYVARSKAGTVFYFEPRNKNGITLAVFKTQLLTEKFKPFLLSFDRVEAWYQREAEKRDSGNS